MAISFNKFNLLKHVGNSSRYFKQVRVLLNKTQVC